MVDKISNEDSVENSISITRQKIIFIGDAFTGKTSIINRIMNNPFNEAYEVSIGIDFMSKNIRFRGRKIQISVSTNNMLKSPKNTQQFEKDEKIVVKKERNYNINSYRNNNATDIKETEEQKPRYRYLRGYVKRFDAEQKEKEANKEKEPEIENKNTHMK